MSVTDRFSFPLLSQANQTAIDISSQSMATGLVRGGVVSINGMDSSKFDISAGVGYIVDYYTNPDSPILTRVTWSASIGVSLASLLTSSTSFIGIDIAGSIVQKPSEFMTDEARTIIILAVISHVTHTFIDVIGARPRVFGGSLIDADDLASALGPFNKEGNVYDHNGSSLEITKTFGESFLLGANYNDGAHSPNIIESAPKISGTSPPMLYGLRNGSGGFVFTGVSTTIDPNNYDNDAVLTAVTPTWWSIQRIYFFPATNTEFISYSQDQYETSTLALVFINIFDQDIATQVEQNGGILRCFLIVQQGTTDLSDPARAIFIQATRYQK